ncbi:MAG: hypothetical protein H6662_19090 [Ardenticatenaceae bacterium]|nr:hypothetical protein [Anaerolineales bacterium]MCB8923698.1 hypothetical protein [Ardenticatenaceae bacterium]
MAKKQEATVEVVVEEVAEKKNVLFDTAHKALLIGFGVIGMSQDFIVDGREEMNKLFDKLVGRGEEMEKESREWVQDVMKRNKKVEEEVAVEMA